MNSTKILLALTALLFFLPTHTTVWAQCREIDSLQRKIPTLQAKQKVDAENDLANHYIKSKQWELALGVVESEALPLAQSIRYERGIAEAYLNIGSALYFRDNKDKSFNEGISYFQKGLELMQKTGTKMDVAMGYEMYGAFFWEILYLKQQYADSSAKYYAKAYDIFATIDQKTRASKNASNVARAYFELGNDDKALAYTKKAVEIDQQNTGYSEAKLLNRLMENQRASQNAFNYAVMFIALLVVAAAVGLGFAFAQVRKANVSLQAQKKAVEDKNDKIEEQNKEIEQRNIKLQETFAELEKKNKEIEKSNKSILLQQTEIEMRNTQLAEANEELLQSQEEIKSQRDNVEQLAREISEQADELKRSYETLTILSRIGQTITASLDISNIFDNFFTYTTQLMDADSFRVIEFEEETGDFIYKFNIEKGTKKPLVKIQAGEGINPAILCAKEGRSIVVNKREDLELYGLDHYAMRQGYNAMLYYPLFDNDKPKGAVGVFSKNADAYDVRDLEALTTLSTYVMIALKNAETYGKLNTAQAQLVESEKMAALGNLVAGVAHEINTPVGICVTAASRVDSKTQEFVKIMESGQMKRKDMTDYLEVATEGSKILLTNLKRAADLVQSFKRVAVEQSSEEKRMFNLKTYIEETILSLRPELKNKPVEVHLELEEIEIDSYAGAFSQVLTNFIMNSLIHGFKGKEAGNIRIKTTTKNKSMILTYSDDGNGMTPEVLEKIYEPFFTTNRSGGGSGLGMNIVYNLIAQKLGGKINVESAVGKGVTFTIEVPMA
ncbi:MAG: hypothetical protein EAZ95_08625 [Bacteroidetes bacterium]|nr:MAG: hypothetical protein EAZ95_08625 [Bacteroidota bacterium]